jgi:hypothetical protein
VADQLNRQPRYDRARRVGRGPAGHQPGAAENRQPRHNQQHMQQVVAPQRQDRQLREGDHARLEDQDFDLMLGIIDDQFMGAPGDLINFNGNDFDFAPGGFQRPPFMPEAGGIQNFNNVLGHINHAQVPHVHQRPIQEQQYFQQQHFQPFQPLPHVARLPAQFAPVVPNAPIPRHMPLRPPPRRHH